MLIVIYAILLKKQCLDPSQIEIGFEIARNIDNLDNIYNELVKEDGTILKKRNYYNVRGVTDNKTNSYK